MYPNMTEELLDPRPEDVPALKKELSEGVEKYRADMDKDFLKEKLEELKAADTDIVEKQLPHSPPALQFLKYAQQEPPKRIPSK